MALLCLSFLLVLAAQGHAHVLLEDPTLASAFPLESATLQQVAREHDMDAHLMGAAAVGAGPNCTVKCNDEKYEALRAGGKHGVDCWGTFSVFCKGAGEKACGLGGFKCEGHFIGFKAPCGAKIGVCAGQSKKFGKALVHAHNDTKVKVFTAAGGIGTSGVAIAAPNVSLPTSIDWPQGALAAVPGLAALYGGEMGHHVAALKGGPLTLKKAFGDGAGGGLLAVKKLDKKDAEKWAEKHAEKHGHHDHNNMDFAKLEKKAEKKLRKLGYSLPIDPSYLNFQGAIGGEGCQATCNGQAAPFRGRLPCIGKFKVECEVAAGHGAKLAAAAAPHADDGTVLATVAGCNGFWSGVFGRKCKGFSYFKADVKGIDKFAYCSGRTGNFAKKRGHGFVTGGGCRGKSLYAVQYTPESSTTATLSAS